MRIRNVCLTTSALACAGLAAAWFAGCATPTEIGPTTQPGGIQTPKITFPAPPQTGLAQLPGGFHPCGEYDAPVKLDDGTWITLHGCVFCSDNQNDRTVYTQLNCKGSYHFGIRSSNPGQQNNPPPAKRLTSVSGDLNTDSSTVGFKSLDAFDLVQAMTDFGDGLVINDKTISYWVGQGTTSFPAGSTVSMNGKTSGITDVLYWAFGSASIKAFTDTGDSISVQIGYSDEWGIVAIPYQNGVMLPDDIGVLPWRR
jgi:hypothetical protein